MKLLRIGHYSPQGLVAVAVLVTALGFSACQALNDQPGKVGKAKVNIEDLQRQMGQPGVNGTRLNSPGNSDASELVETLLVGAVVVHGRDTPYSNDEAITSDVEDALKEDVQNSANFFAIIDLPTTAETVEFELPPPTAGQWQVMAGGLRVDIDLLGELEGNDDAFIYYGFSEDFLTQGDAEDNVVVVEMKRACLSSAPAKGCAQVDTDGRVIVEPSLELIDVFINGNRLGGAGLPTIEVDGIKYSDLAYPIAANDATSEKIMELSIKGLLLDAGAANGDSVEVVVTHQNAPTYSTDCSGFSYSSGVTSLSDSCLSVYTTVLIDPTF